MAREGSAGVVRRLAVRTSPVAVVDQDEVGEGAADVAADPIDVVDGSPLPAGCLHG